MTLNLELGRDAHAGAAAQRHTGLRLCFGRRGGAGDAASGKEQEKAKGRSQLFHWLTDTPMPAMDVDMDGVTLTPRSVTRKAAWARGWLQAASRQSAAERITRA